MTSMIIGSKTNATTGNVLTTYTYGPHMMQIVTTTEGEQAVYGINSDWQATNIRLSWYRPFNEDGDYIEASSTGAKINIDQQMHDLLEARDAMTAFIIAAGTAHQITLKEK